MKDFLLDILPFVIGLPLMRLLAYLRYNNIDSIFKKHSKK